METTNKPNKYFAFISYKREDEEWAVWFHHELENYHLPATLNGRADLPSEFRPVFRDIDELKAGNLPEQIYNALATSAYLIVICSPNSARSKWVNKEIRDFIEIGKATIGLFDYALVTKNGEDEIWNSNDDYDVLVLDKNCELALQ